MLIDAESLPNAESTLAVPGTLCVTPLSSGGNLIHLGPAAGWMVPRGLLRWEREISFVARGDMTAELGRVLRATLPHEQVPPKKLPLAYRAVERSPFLAITRKLAADARKQGLRVHTVGVDRVSAGFFYFAEGGQGPNVHAQANLIEMLTASLKPSATNAEIAALQDGLVDRLLAFFSDGVVSELAVELADALPRMSNDGTGLAGTQLEVFELQARALSSRSARWEGSARDIAEAVQGAAGRGERTARVPLYGEARQQMLRPLKIIVGTETLTLPARYRWTVIGQPREELRAPDRPEPTQPIAQPTPSPPRAGPAVPRPEPTTGMRRLPKIGPAEEGAPASATANAGGTSTAATAKPANPAGSSVTEAKADTSIGDTAVAVSTVAEAGAQLAARAQAVPPEVGAEAVEMPAAAAAPETLEVVDRDSGAPSADVPAAVGEAIADTDREPASKGKDSKGKGSKGKGSKGKTGRAARREAARREAAKNAAAKSDAPPKSEAGKSAAAKSVAPKSDAAKSDTAKSAAKQPTTPAVPPSTSVRRSMPRAVVVLLLIATALAVYVRWHESIGQVVWQYLHPE